MNLIGLCIVLVSLRTGGFIETIGEASASQEIGSQPDEKVATSEETIAENGDTAGDFEAVEKFVGDSLWPTNEPKGPASEAGRTFGVKRLQFMMMPMIYKMGIMMTMIVVLTVISLKSLAIGVLLLVLKLSAFFGKFYASTQHQAPIHGWPAQPQPVHVHLHNSGDAGYHHHNHPYDGWEPASSPTNGQHYYYKR